MITVIGYILTTLGFGGLAYSLFTVNTNKRYSWTSPFSSFEKTIIAVAIISFIILLVGIIMVIFSFVKKKNEDKLNSLKNLGCCQHTTIMSPQKADHSELIIVFE